MQTIRNTIKRYRDGEPLKSPPKGPNIMGLASIKNIVIKQDWGGVESEKDGLQFFFRCRDDKQMCVTHKVTANIDPKSNLYKLLVRMTRGKYDDTFTESATFTLINSMVNKWYEVMVKVQPWKSADGTEIEFAKVGDNDVIPARPEDCPASLPFDHWGFKSGKMEPAKAAVAKPPEPNQTLDDDIPF